MSLLVITRPRRSLYAELEHAVGPTERGPAGHATTPEALRRATWLPSTGAVARCSEDEK